MNIDINQLISEAESKLREACSPWYVKFDRRPDPLLRVEMVLGEQRLRLRAHLAEVLQSRHPMEWLVFHMHEQFVRATRAKKPT